MINKLKKYSIPVVIVLVAILVVVMITSNPPKSRRGGPAKTATLSVNTMLLKPVDYQIKIDSFGVVKPRTQSVLTSQVSGQIVAISKNFRDGGFFNKGDVLVKVDDRDYQADVNIAKAAVLSAKQNLMEEKAKVAQAEEDWHRLGNGEKASDLVLRKPQLASAQAQLLSATAKLEKSKLALERTEIKAPYAGRVLTKKVDVGQVISNNAQLANIYASDYVEIRLPINNSDLPFTLLPEQQSAPIEVQLSSQLTDHQQWKGFLSRTESTIDSSTQQLYVVAQIDAPFDFENNDLPLKIGQYLTASIKGKLLSNVMIIPNSSIYQGSYVYIVKDDKLLRKEVTIAWQNDQDAMISRGLAFGDLLVTTSLGKVSSGTKVQVINAKNGARRMAKEASFKNQKRHQKRVKPSSNHQRTGHKPEQSQHNEGNQS